MHIEGSYKFPAGIDQVWALMIDPNAIAKALPGAHDITPIEGEVDSWTASAKIGFAAISGTYTGTIRMLNKTPPTQYRLVAQGEGQQTYIKGAAVITLTAIDENNTTVSWDAEADIAGRLAGVGQRVFGAAANVISKQFFGALAKQLS